MSTTASRMANPGLWPATAGRDESGTLQIAGVNVEELGREFGTPLYVYDEGEIRRRCRTYRDALDAAYPDGRVAYAGKAWLSHALLQIIRDEGLDLDTVSGGEMAYAIHCGFPAERISFHGNNKSPEELAYAIEQGVGRIVVDNFREIELLASLGERADEPVSVLLRLNPGIDAHTHDYRKTGIVDSKFGVGIASGDAESAVVQLMDAPNINLLGFHAHIGSQIFEVDPFEDTIEALFAFAAAMREKHGLEVSELSPGGGFGIAYAGGDPAGEIGDYVARVGASAIIAAGKHGFRQPRLTIEPGRSIVGPAGVAIYTVGARKAIPGVRTYLSVDGGMADNIRPALYGAVYSAESVSKTEAGKYERVTLAGKYCESGDVLIEEVDLPHMHAGDLLAIPASGAYSLAMASNYNLASRPAVVFVDDGYVRLVQRRETLDDIARRDVL